MPATLEIAFSGMPEASVPQDDVRGSITQAEMLDGLVQALGLEGEGNRLEKFYAANFTGLEGGLHVSSVIKETDGNRSYVELTVNGYDRHDLPERAITWLGFVAEDFDSERYEALYGVPYGSAYVVGTLPEAAYNAVPEAA